MILRMPITVTCICVTMSMTTIPLAVPGPISNVLSESLALISIVYYPAKKEPKIKDSMQKRP